MCVMGRCENKKLGGVVRQEKLREVLSKVRGAILCKEK